jgi:hypothetical protein
MMAIFLYWIGIVLAGLAGLGWLSALDEGSR